MWRDQRSGIATDVYAQLIGRGGAVSDVGTGGEPAGLDLGPIEPNPSAGPVAIRLRLPRTEAVVLRVHDVAGRAVTTLADGVLRAGEQTVRWDGRGGAGLPLPGGLYWVVLESAGKRLAVKVVVLPR